MSMLRNVLLFIIISIIIIPHNSFSQKFVTDDKITSNNGKDFIHTVNLDHQVPKSCHCVAFRLDDVQDYYLDHVQIAVMDTFQQKNASLTIGIIGHYIGNDTLLLEYLKTKIVNGSSKIEIANHGWNHEDFTTFNKTQQSTLITKTNEKLFDILGIRPIIFIPPYNAVNNDLIENLQENKFTFISSNETEEKPTYLLQAANFYNLPSTVVTGDLNDDNTEWYALNHTQTFMHISKSLKNYGYAIIEMHPFEHSIRHGLHMINRADVNQIHELKLLIDEIRDNGLRIVTISEIPKHVTNKTIPNWTNNIFKWYENGDISDTEAIKSINYLLEKRIVVL